MPKMSLSDKRVLKTSLSRLHTSSILGWSRGRKFVPSAWRTLQHRFLDLTKVEFWVCQEAESDFYVPFDHLNRSFTDLKKVMFSVRQELENDFKVTFDKLNHCFFDFTQIKFWSVQEAENDFAVPCHH